MLKEGSVAYNIWKKPSKEANVERKYYLFDIQNPDEVISGKEKPRVIEKGPYVYNEIMTKADVKFLDENTIQYAPISTLHYNQSLSNGSLDDKITFINVPAMVINFLDFIILALYYT